MLFVTRQMQRTCCTKIGSNELQGDSAKKFLFSATHLDDCVIPVTAAVSRASLLKPPLFRPKHSLCSAFHSHLWLKLNPIFMTFWGLTLLWHSGGTVACIRPSGSLAWLSYQLGRGKCCTKIGSKSSFCSMAWCLVQCVACVVPGHHPYKPTLLSLEHTLQPWAGETEETSSKLLASQNLSHHLLSLLRPLDVLPHPEHHLLEILDRYITYWEMFSENT